MALCALCILIGSHVNDRDDRKVISIGESNQLGCLLCALPCKCLLLVCNDRNGLATDLCKAGYDIMGIALLGLDKYTVICELLYSLVCRQGIEAGYGTVQIIGALVEYAAVLTVARKYGNDLRI